MKISVRWIVYFLKMGALDKNLFTRKPETLSCDIRWKWCRDNMCRIDFLTSSQKVLCEDDVNMRWFIFILLSILLSIKICFRLSKKNLKLFPITQGEISAQIIPGSSLMHSY